jgi:undecaprenyl-diphosphooligosaccharide--protein glycosyltransferase
MGRDRECVASKDKGKREVIKEDLELKSVLMLMAIAYLFSMMVRMIWIYQFHGTDSFYWLDQLMINTNDGYFFASGAQHALLGLHEHNPRLPSMFEHGAVFFTVLFTKITPFSLETIILYMPALISSLVVVPIILIARLYGMSLWGFFAALLGSITWSYYNRTMVGYYDTDMFSAMAPMFILYFLMKSTIDFNLKSALFAGLFITIYPFLYDQGKAVIFAMGIMYGLYLLFYHHKEKMTYLSLILVFFALTPLPLHAPYDYLLKVALLIALYTFLKRSSIEMKYLMIASVVLFLSFMFFGNVFWLIFTKVEGYIATGTATEGLHFYSVKQTVREAGQIPFETFANRISGSQLGFVLALVGYLVLVFRHRAFILALPLVGIGGFALMGGLRFTVYAVPIAAMSAIYLFFMMGSFFYDKRVKYGVIIVATIGMLVPNIVHIIEYRVSTVFNKAEVKDLDKLRAISNSKDYTLTWWDYGYPIWFYSNTNTLIDGGKHNNDNFIISQMMQSSSADFAVNLGRLAVETYVDSNYSIVADTLFETNETTPKDPNLLLAELDDPNYALPKKSRDIYLYLPYRMLGIYPTVATFGNLDLTTGKKLQSIEFYPARAIDQKGGLITLANGVRFDSRKGVVSLPQGEQLVKSFIIAEDRHLHTKVNSHFYHIDGEYVMLFMKSYGQFILMDLQTFDSLYVQMFILGNYDQNLFELVISSPYSKIYKFKK